VLPFKLQTQYSHSAVLAQNNLQDGTAFTTAHRYMTIIHIGSGWLLKKKRELGGTPLYDHNSHWFRLVAEKKT